MPGVRLCAPGPPAREGIGHIDGIPTNKGAPLPPGDCRHRSRSRILPEPLRRSESGYNEIGAYLKIPRGCLGDAYPRVVQSQRGTAVLLGHMCERYDETERIGGVRMLLRNVRAPYRSEHRMRGGL